MGAFYSFGNMAPYMTSYMRKYSPNNADLTSTGEQQKYQSTIVQKYNSTIVQKYNGTKVQ